MHNEKFYSYEEFLLKLEKCDIPDKILSVYMLSIDKFYNKYMRTSTDIYINRPMELALLTKLGSNYIAISSDIYPISPNQEKYTRLIFRMIDASFNCCASVDRPPSITNSDIISRFALLDLKLFVSYIINKLPSSGCMLHNALEQRHILVDIRRPLSHILLIKGWYDLWLTLLQKGCKPSIPDTERNTELHIIVKNASRHNLTDNKLEGYLRLIYSIIDIDIKALREHIAIHKCKTHLWISGENNERPFERVIDPVDHLGNSPLDYNEEIKVMVLIHYKLHSSRADFKEYFMNCKPVPVVATAKLVHKKANTERNIVEFSYDNDTDIVSSVLRQIKPSYATIRKFFMECDLPVGGIQMDFPYLPSINMLGNDVFRYICSFLTLRDYKNLFLVCKVWYEGCFGAIKVQSNECDVYQFEGTKPIVNQLDLTQHQQHQALLTMVQVACLVHH